MRREVRWDQAAVEHLFELTLQDQRQARRIMMTVRTFASGQRVDLKKLSGQDAWRIRVGDWRVLVVLDGADASIQRIDNRRDAY